MRKRQVGRLLKRISQRSQQFSTWLPMLLLPVVFSLIMPCLLIVPAYKYDISERSILQVLEELPPGELRETIFSFGSTNKQMIYFSVHYLFAPFLLIIPLMAASVLGSGSFAREKERKTMESLLLAPISAPDLFERSSPLYPCRSPYFLLFLALRNNSQPHRLPALRRVNLPQATLANPAVLGKPRPQPGRGLSQCLYLRESKGVPGSIPARRHDRPPAHRRGCRASHRCAPAE